MAEVTNTDLHVDGLLTDLSIAYMNPMYIAPDICAAVPVRKQSDIIPKYDQSHWFRNEAHVRAPGTRSRRGGFAVDKTDTYYATRKSFGFEIPDELRDNQDDPYDMDRDATEFVTDKIMMAREVDAATNFFTTSIWTGDQTGVASGPAANQFIQWNDYAASLPLVDLTTFMDNIEGRIAREPNRLVLGKQVWSQLKWHPDFLDTIKYTQRAQMTTELAAALLELESILVGRAIYTTSAEGTAEGSVTYTRVWGKSALLLFTPPRASLLSPAACYQFTWARVPNSLMYIKRMRDEEAEIDIIESNGYWDQKVTAAGAGLFMATAVA